MQGVEHSVKNTDLFIFPLKISQPAAGCGLCWNDSLPVFLCPCCSPVTVTGWFFLFQLFPVLSDSPLPCSEPSPSMGVFSTLLWFSRCLL